MKMRQSLLATAAPPLRPIPVMQVSDRVAVPLVLAPATYGLSRSAIYRAAKEGKIRLMKCGRTTLVDDASARLYLAELPPVRFASNDTKVS